MGYFVLVGIALLVALIGFFAGGVYGNETTDRLGNSVKNNTGKLIRAASVGIGLFLVLLISACGSYTQVENGHIGMLKSFGALQDNPLEAGPHLKAPWQSVDEVSVQVETRTYHMTDGDGGIGSAVSSDNQPVYMVVVVEHQLVQAEAVDLYQEVGPTFIEKKLDPAVPELTKRVTANYKAIDFAKNRAQIRAEIEALLQAEMDAVGIRVNKVSLKNVDFTDSLKTAIEATVAAEQNAKAAEQQVKVTEAEAKQKVAAAEGDAQATLTQARADAAAQRLKQNTLTPLLVQMAAIEKLNPNVSVIVCDSGKVCIPQAVIATASATATGK